MEQKAVQQFFANFQENARREEYDGRSPADIPGEGRVSPLMRVYHDWAEEATFLEKVPPQSQATHRSAMDEDHCVNATNQLTEYYTPADMPGQTLSKQVGA